MAMRDQTGRVQPSYTVSSIPRSVSTLPSYPLLTRPQLSKKHHPDAPGGSPEQFHVINDAYATLGDAASRAAYDSSTRPASERGGGMGTPGSSSSFHPHSPQARAAAGPHRAWGGRPPPGAHYTGPKRQHGNLGHGMGMGSGPGSVPPGTRWGRKEGHGMGANARHRMNEGRLDEEVKGESVLWRSMVVFIVLVIIVGLGGGVSAKADVGEQGDDHVEVWREHCELEEEELD